MSLTHYNTKTSYQHLSSFERGAIASLLKEGKSISAIASHLNRHRSTIYREIKRGSVIQKQEKNAKELFFLAYFPDTAHLLYLKRRRNSYTSCMLPKLTPSFLQDFEHAMKQKVRIHSVDSFIHSYKKQQLHEVIPSTKTMYTYIKQGLLSIKPIDLPRMVRIRQRQKKRPSTTKILGQSIEQRSDSINERREVGHWEIDCVLGSKRKSEPVIMSLVDRFSRKALTVLLPEKKATFVNQAILDLKNHYPIQSITADNGREFSRLNELEGIDIYYAHPYASYERGSNENFNGLLREYLPKGKSFQHLSKEKLNLITQAINLRPRRIHCYLSATEVFQQYVSS